MRDRLFVHIAWTTRERRPLIDADGANYLIRHLPIIARQERGRIVVMGIVTTHVHLVVRLHPAACIPRMMQRMKGGSAFGANAQGLNRSVLRWAKGYGIASVSERALDRVADYVRQQHVRHPSEAIPGWHVAHPEIAAKQSTCPFRNISRAVASATSRPEPRL